MKRVAWCNVWNHSTANSGDAGSLIHLSESGDKSGTTLCGKSYPNEKGDPFSQRYCKQCVSKAKQTAEINLSSLEWIA